MVLPDWANATEPSRLLIDRARIMMSLRDVANCCEYVVVSFASLGLFNVAECPCVHTGRRLVSRTYQVT